MPYELSDREVSVLHAALLAYEAQHPQLTSEQAETVSRLLLMLKTSDPPPSEATERWQAG